MKKLFKKSLIFVIIVVLALCSFGGCDTFTQDGPKYEVTFISDGKFYLEIEVESGGYVYAPTTPQKQAHTFTGWYSDFECENEFSFPAQITNDVILYAGFEENLDQENACTITFKVGDTIYLEDSVNAGNTVKTPTPPTKYNHLFLSWCKDKALTDEYDFSQAVNTSLTLYAKFTIDAAAITNKITTEVMHSVVKIYNKSYNSNFFGETSSTTSQGSGVIFKQESGYFYILTNCHVAVIKNGYSKQSLVVEDYQGKQFAGELVFEPDPAYDLACIRFKPTTQATNAKVLALANSSAEVGDDVIALGAPNGQTNALSFGKFTGYDTATLSKTEEYLSNVKFEVIKHTAYINNGSSGGPLINSNLKIVGINYAGVEDNSYGLAIPLDKINEFLDAYLG